MDQFWKSCAEAITKRTNTAILGTFTFFWAIHHWQGFYATLFVPSNLIYQKYGLLKNEYVFNYFFGARFSHPKILWFHIYLPSPHVLWGLLFPAILTYLYIWWLPKLVLIHAFKSEQEHKLEKKKIRLKLDRKLVEYERQTADQRSEAIEIQKDNLRAEVELARKEAEAALKVAEQEKQALLARLERDKQALAAQLEKEKQAAALPDEAWAKDYQQAKKNPEFGNFNLLIDAIYQWNGRTRRSVQGNAWVGVNLPGNILAFADTNGLINLDNKSETVSFTDKGKYFVKRYQSDSR
ncbi:MAG TPA: hypothetical protein VLI54_04660 [Bacillota bacterium]|nr:hypothetical protein [Bacillota bacterium]